MSKKLALKEITSDGCNICYSLDKPDKIHQDYGLHILGGYEGVIDKKLHQTIKPRMYKFYLISHLIEGRGWLWIKNEGKKFFVPGEAIVMCPNQIFDFSGLDLYREDFICFRGAVADQLASSGILKSGIIKIGLVRYLLPIIKLISNPHKDFQIKANISLQRLMTDLYFEQQKKQKDDRGILFEKLIDEIIASPERWWTVNEMAQMLNMSKNQFNIFFVKQAGMTPKKYVDKLKMEHAKKELLNTSKNLTIIAEDLGYSDPFHFSKRFKQITGISPNDFRNQ